jgi:tetratricopeptide (TPR) repeat protein
MRRLLFALSLLALTFSVSVASESAEAMIARVSAKLSDAPKSLAPLSSLDVYNVGLTSLLAELSLFEARYGIKPEETKGWAKVRAQSLSLLDKLDGRYRKSTDIVSASTRTLLLELSGRYSRALQCYPEIKTDAFCGSWMMTVTQQNDLRRSYLYEKLGDKKKALEILDSTLAAREFTFRLPNADIHFVRHGLLNLEAGRNSVGVADLQRVVDLYPNTLGAEVAKETLTKTNQLIPPTAARIKDHYLSGQSDSYLEALNALREHRFPDSFEVLRDLLDSAPPLLKNQVISAMGNLGDKRAIPILEADLRKDTDFSIQFCDLVAMAQLGEYKLIQPFFERIAQAKTGQGYPLGFINDRLRILFKGGPKFSIPDNMKPADFSTQWLAWLRVNAPTAIAPLKVQNVGML